MGTSNRKAERRACFAAATLMLASVSVPALADEVRWAGPGDGLFNDPANWVEGRIPGEADTALFGRDPGSAQFIVTFGRAHTTARLLVANQNPVFYLNRRTYTVTELVQIGSEHGVAASLTLTDGGVLETAGGLAVAAAPDAEGELTVTGGLTRLTVDGEPGIVVGQSGDALFRVRNAGLATSIRGVVGGTPEGSARAVVQGLRSRWSVGEGGLIVGDAGAGELEVSDQGVVAGDVLIAGRGRLLGDGSIEGNLVNRGLVEPGLPLRTFAVVGHYGQEDSGTLVIHLRGGDPDADLSVLAVQGRARLAGILSVELIGDFRPGCGATFSFLGAEDGSEGRFAETRLPLLDSGRKFIVLYGSHGASLYVTARADFNEDGELTINDYITFQSAWRSHDARADWDASGSWTVNDFIAFQSDFRKGCP